MRRAAPQAEVGVVSLAGAVHAAAHYSNRNGMLAGVGRHFLDLTGQLDECLIFHARATRAADDIERRKTVVHHAPHPTGRNIGEDHLCGSNFLRLAGVWHGERHANCVTDTPAHELLKSDASLDDAVRRHAGFCDTQVERNIRASLGETPIHIDHLPRIGVFERHAIASEPQRVEQLAVLQGTCQHRTDRVVLGKFFFLGRIHAAAVDPHPQGAVVAGRYIHNKLHLVLPRLCGLMVVEVARVVAELVDEGCRIQSQPIIFLKVDR